MLAAVGTRRLTVATLVVLVAIVTPASWLRQPSVPVDPDVGSTADTFRRALARADLTTPGAVRAPEADTAAVLVASGVYEGIDLIVRRGPAEPAYGFVVGPNARADRIRLSLIAADGLDIDDAGDLVVHHRGRALRQRRPRAFQETTRGRVDVRADYRIGPDGDVRFAIGQYDRSRPLVIEPWLTFPARLGEHPQD